MDIITNVEIIRNRINAAKGTGKHAKAVKNELIEYYCEKKADQVNSLPVFKLDAFASFLLSEVMKPG